MILVRRLPNTHPNFEMDDFFGSLWNNPVRTLFAQRKLYDEDEHVGPISPAGSGSPTIRWPSRTLIELTTDPSYDVKAEAVRSLGLSQSSEAGPALLEILDDPERSTSSTTWPGPSAN